jgi:quercetin dioxygenase-like cupin family protein
MKTKHLPFLICLILLGSTVVTSCNNAQQPKKDISQGIFPKGQPGPAENFTGKAWNTGLVNPDSTYTSAVGNVYFEPGARSNWHMHPGGQILVITDGVGYHQIKGQPKQVLHKGDVVKCPPNTLHWHGASPDSGMQQLYIVPNTEKGVVDWKQPVTDEEYHAK